MRLAIVIVFMLLTLDSIASAQPSLTPPVSPVTQTPASVEQKSPGTAVLLSLGITTAGYIALSADSDGVKWIGVGAIFLGPSTGQWYAGEVGGLGMAARGVGFLSAAYGFAKLLESETDCEVGLDAGCADEQARARTAGRVGTFFLLTGAGLWFGSTIYDVVLAKRAADRWNASHAVNLSPVVLGDAGHHMPGLVLTGRF